MPLFPPRLKSPGEKISVGFIYVILIAWGLAMLFPLFWALNSSVKDNLTIYEIPPKILPHLATAIILEMDYTDYTRRLGKESSDDRAALEARLKDVLKEDAAFAIWGLPDEFRKADLRMVRVTSTIEGRVAFEASGPFYKQDLIKRRTFWTARMSAPLLSDAVANLGIMEKLGYQFHPEAVSAAQGGSSIPEGKPPAFATPLAEQAAAYMQKFGIRGEITKLEVGRTFLHLFDNYIVALEASIRGSLPFYVYLLNSAIVTGAIVFGNLLLNSLAGYALSRLFTVRVSKVILMFFLATLMIPDMVILIPLYILVSRIGLLNTYPGIFLTGMASAFAILLFKGFFDALPADLIDASRIDGASELMIFRSVVVPLSSPVFATLAVFAFLYGWNDFLWPFLVAQTPKLWTFAVALYMYSQSLGADNLQMALVFITAIPVIIMFIVFQNYLQHGVVMTGIKG